MSEILNRNLCVQELQVCKRGLHACMWSTLPVGQWGNPMPMGTLRCYEAKTLFPHDTYVWSTLQCWCKWFLNLFSQLFIILIIYRFCFNVWKWLHDFMKVHLLFRWIFLFSVIEIKIKIIIIIVIVIVCSDRNILKVSTRIEKEFGDTSGTVDISVIGLSRPNTGQNDDGHFLF